MAVRSRSVIKVGTKHDWVQAQDLFIDGLIVDEETDQRKYFNLKELSSHCDIPYQQVRERAAKGRWTEQRTSAQAEIMKQRQKKRATKLSGEALAFDDQSLRVAKMGMGLVATRLNEIAEAVKAKRSIMEANFARMANGDRVDWKELMSAINYKEMDGMANAAQKFNELGQRAMGNDINRIEISGPGGAPVEVAQQVSIRDEMLRTDTEKLAAMVSLVHRSSFSAEQVLGMVANIPDDDDDDIEEAELLEIEAGQHD